MTITSEMLAGYRLGENGETLELESSRDNYAVALSMLQQSRRDAVMFSRQLDGALYDTSEFSAVVSHCVSRQPRFRFRILLQQIDPLIKSGHRLIELSRRLSSSIEFRRVHEDYTYYNQAFMVFDERGIIKRRYADRYEGIASFNAPLEARELVNFFDEVWSRSEPDPNLRRLHL
jgi:hypothetical protein